MILSKSYPTIPLVGNSEQQRYTYRFLQKSPIEDIVMTFEFLYAYVIGGIAAPHTHSSKLPSDRMVKRFFGRTLIFYMEKSVRHSWNFYEINFAYCYYFVSTNRVEQ